MLFTTTLFYILVALICGIFLYKTFFIYVFLRYKDTNRTINPQKNSIYFLISVKNESAQLLELLTHLKEKQLPIFPNAICYIINDHSTSEEKEKMNEIVALFDFVSMHDSTKAPGKKNAIRYGYELIPDGNILLLDADCRPQNKNWSYYMNAGLSENEAMLAYAPFFPNNHFVNKLIRFECMYIASQYMGFALRGIPYMGVGRNMAITKKSYNKVKHIIVGENLLSGDDDLLIQAMNSLKLSIGITTDPGTFVYSKAETTYLKYLKQKVRQITTSTHYSLLHKILLASDSASHILFTLGILLAIIILPLKTVLFLFLAKWLIAQIFYSAVAKKLQEKDLIYFAGIWEFVYSVHLIILSLYSFVARKNVWK